MKKILLLLCFFLISSVLVFADMEIPVRVVDNAGLLTEAQKDSLIRKIASIITLYKFDLVIVTERSIGNIRPMDYADDFFDYNGYGFGPNADGCIFLVVMDTRDFFFSTSGRGIRMLNETAYSKLYDESIKFLTANRSYESFMAFLNTWEMFLELDAKGRSYNFFYKWNVVLVLAAWLFAFAIGFFAVHILKNEMNTAFIKSQACDYMVPGSLLFKQSKDRFLYSTVTKTKKQSNSSSGGGTRVGSSGRSHGGRGGKF